LIAPLAILLLLFALTLATAFNVQVLHHREWRQEWHRACIHENRAKPKRGRIFDRDGLLLASNELGTGIAIKPGACGGEERDSLAAFLQRVADVDSAAFHRLMQASDWEVWARRQIRVSPEQAVELARHSGLGKQVMRVHPELYRSYPKGKLFCQILGFAGGEMQGLAGVEFRYEDLLRGEAGVTEYYVDGRGRMIPGTALSQKPVRDGVDLYLYGSAACQRLAQRALTRLAADGSITRGSCVVMGIETGEVIALASSPDFDPNLFRRYVGRPDSVLDANDVVRRSWSCRPLVYATLGAIALGEGGVTVRGQVVTSDWLVGNLGRAEPLVTELGKELQRARLEEPLDESTRRLGLARKTGIDLPGESPGVGVGSRASDAISGIRMTPIQMAQVIATFSNSGRTTLPKVARIDRDTLAVGTGSYRDRERVMLRGVARSMRGLLVENVGHGTAKLAAISGYEVGGLAWNEPVGSGLQGSGFAGFVDPGSGMEPYAIVVTLVRDGSARGAGGNPDQAMAVFRLLAHSMIGALEDADEAEMR
jgi:cell division protein FtsI/penicillin-binding protein 2